MNTTTETTALSALAVYLECEADDLTESSYQNGLFEYGNQEYLCLTDSEADEAVKEYIRESVWAFNASFLACMTGLDEEMFAFASEKCEGANDAILRTIEQTCGLNEFVESAVSADSRGHFLSGYDGEENDSGDYYIYRVN